jgi:hypothetical protein
MAGELLIAVLRQYQAGRQQDRLGVRAGRPKHADGAVLAAVRDDEPVIVCKDDPSARRGRSACPPASGDCQRRLGQERGADEQACGQQDDLQPAWQAGYGGRVR